MISTDNLKKIQTELGDGDAILIMSPANRFYLTGFESTDGFAVITRDHRVFSTDFRYIEAAKAQIFSFDVLLQSGRMFAAIKQIADTLKIKRIFVEAEYVSVDLFEKLKKTAENIVFVSDGGIDRTIRAMRAVKTEEEISRISTAVQISEEALKRTLPQIRAGITERTAAAIIEYQMRLCGGDGVAFETIAISGANSAKPHGVPTDKEIENGDFLTVDFGAKYKGYCSDMTRTFAIGSPKSDMKEVYDTVLYAQREAIERIKSGAVCSEIDATARNIIDENYNGCFGHSLGHSVGIEIHETPTLSPACEVRLKNNTVITCEPGIYLEGKFGVRIEDLVVVTENGCRNLNSFDKELMIL